MADFDERRRLLLWKQKRLEELLATETDRRRRDAAQAEYSGVVDELERMDAGTWTPRRREAILKYRGR